jgi:hypothetical protein
MLGVGRAAPVTQEQSLPPSRTDLAQARTTPSKVSDSAASDRRATS